MNKEDKAALTVLGGGAFVLMLSFLPVIRDPYYHIKRVNFWEWAAREIRELITGERARLAYYTFEPMLRKYLQLKKPLLILEWGPGRSTKIMTEEVPNAEIFTVEHDADWAAVWKTEFTNNMKVHLITIPLGENYFKAPLEWGMKFDFIFVDGADPRVDCLETALQVMADDGIVILHDRENYQRGIQLFKIIEEDAHTVVMMK